MSTFTHKVCYKVKSEYHTVKKQHDFFFFWTRSHFRRICAAKKGTNHSSWGNRRHVTTHEKVDLLIVCLTWSLILWWWMENYLENSVASCIDCCVFWDYWKGSEVFLFVCDKRKTTTFYLAEHRVVGLLLPRLLNLTVWSRRQGSLRSLQAEISSFVLLALSKRFFVHHSAKLWITSYPPADDGGILGIVHNFKKRVYSVNRRGLRCPAVK